MDATLDPHYLERVRALTLERGWSVSKPGTGAFLQPTDVWGFPKYPDRTVILPPDADLTAALAAFMEANELFLEETTCWLGTWVYPETRSVYLDITTSCSDLGETLRVVARINAASQRKIIAIYNSALDKTVYL